jgi:hypothetical protein
MHTQFKGHRLPAVLYATKLAEFLKKQPRPLTIVLTGENEPLQSLEYVLAVLTFVPDDVTVELTLKGYKLKQFLKDFKTSKRVDLINFSVSSTGKTSYSEMYDKQLALAQLCKQQGITTRFTFLMTKLLSPHMVRHATRSKWIDQITLKKLQGSTPYIKKNANEYTASVITEDATNIMPGKRFTTLQYNNQEIWIDRDCQDGDYLIFRPDGNVYITWTSKVPFEFL